MLDKIPDSLWVFSALAIAGGLVRLALGIEDDETTMKAEALRLIVIALPIGVISGMYASESGMGKVASFAVCYFAGTASLNIARTMMKHGLAGIIETFVKVKK